MTTCQEVVVETANNDPVFDPIVSGVGGVIGALLGIVIGVLITRCCLVNKIRKIVHSHHKQKAVNFGLHLDDAKSTYFNSREIKSASYESQGNLSVVDEDRNSMVHNNGIILDEDFCDVSVIDFLCEPSLDVMIYKVANQSKQQIHHIFDTTWKDRCTCLSQIFMLILEEYKLTRHLGKVEHDDMLKKVKQKLEECWRKYKTQVNMENIGKAGQNFDVGKSLFANYHDDAAKALMSSYMVVIRSLEIDLIEAVGMKNALPVHEVLVKSFKTMEENIRLCQENDLQFAVEYFCRTLLVCQAFHSGNFALQEQMKKRRYYYGVMLRRLIESDLLTDDENSELWETIREDTEAKFDEINTGLQKALKQLQSQSYQQRRQTISKLRLTQKKSLERYLADSSTLTTTQCIHNYFSLVTELRQQEMTILQELTRDEIARVNQLQKRATIQLQAEYEEMQEKFCESLVTNRLLSNKDAQKVMNELTKKNKRADESVSDILQIQTKVIERESRLNIGFRFAQKINSSEKDNERNKLILEKIMDEKLSDASKFFSSQIYLTDEDRRNILHEFKVNMVFLSNHEDIWRTQIYHELDSELLCLQIKRFIFEKEEERLKSNEDVEDLVKALSEMRKTYEANNSHMYMKAAFNPLDTTDTAQELLCDLTSKALINNLFPDLKLSQKIRLQLEEIKVKVIEKANQAEYVDSVRLQSFAHEAYETVNDIRTQLQHENDIHVQVLKERLNAKHQIQLQKLKEEYLDIRPYSASALTTSEVLDRLLEQERNKRQFELVESSSDVMIMMEVHLERLTYQDRLEAELQELDKSFICKFIKLVGLKRNDLLDCVDKALSQDLASDKEKKKLVSGLLQCWENLRGLKKLPVNQRFRELRSPDGDYEQQQYHDQLMPLPDIGRARKKKFLKRIGKKTKVA